jgi:hypothetical protein
MASPDIDFEDMSDEDFDKLPEPKDTDFKEEGDKEEADEDKKEEPIEEDEPEEKVAQNEDLEPEEEDDPKDPDKELDKEPEKEEDPEPKEEDKDPKEELKEDDTETPEKKVDKDTIDFEAAYNKLMAPFKADGREITPKSPEDFIRMAQMGVNYHDKMAGMKPARAALKTLENNGLLDDEKLSFLVDLNNGNPEAITKLIKQHNIDPLEVDVKSESNYVPTDHTVSEPELALDSVLKDIEGSPSYNKTLHQVTKVWDESSQNLAANNPQIISKINEHIEAGVYDKVMDEVKYERSLGKLKGVSDFQAYQTIGTKMEDDGAFKEPEKEIKKEPKIDPIKEQVRLENKKKASPARKKKATNISKSFNPAEMSDEEFEKFDPKLIGIK